MIAADNLTPAAESRVAQILGVPRGTGSVKKAMAAASIRPDTEFSKEDPTTAQWHYINICLQDNETDLPARCLRRDCVTAKIDDYAQRLRDRNYDRWGAAGDLAFLVHFVGDVHQPLHATTNADRGGTCQQVKVVPEEQNLHFAWDDAVVAVLEKDLGTTKPEATARKLEALYPATKDLMTWKPGESGQIAWVSHQLAESAIYGPLGIPEKPCELHSCGSTTANPVTLTSAYMERAATVAGKQLAAAGYRLAALLNQIWQP